MSSAETETAIRRWAADKHLPDAALARWLELDEAARAAILALARELRLRTAQLVAALELLGEIALRENRGLVAILESDPIRSAIAAGGSAPARGSRMLEALRAIRFPRLTRIRSELEARLRGLGLPPALRVRLPRELASDELTLELRARTRAELEEGLKALERIGPELARIVERLGGGDEI
jgi:predicted NBD/HSP70 family sugar kinase